MKQYTDQELDLLISQTLLREQQVAQLRQAIIAQARQRHRRELLHRWLRTAAVTLSWAACVGIVAMAAYSFVCRHDPTVGLCLMAWPMAAMIGITVHLLDTIRLEA